FLRIPCQPREDVLEAATASGIQVGAGAWRAHLPLFRSTSAGAAAAMRLKRGDTEKVRHQCAENRGRSDLSRVPQARNMCLAENFLPQMKNYFFAKSKSRRNHFRFATRAATYRGPLAQMVPPRSCNQR